MASDGRVSNIRTGNRTDNSADQNILDDQLTPPVTPHPTKTSHSSTLESRDGGNVNELRLAKPSAGSFVSPPLTSINSQQSRISFVTTGLPAIPFPLSKQNHPHVEDDHSTAQSRATSESTTDSGGEASHNPPALIVNFQPHVSYRVSPTEPDIPEDSSNMSLPTQKQAEVGTSSTEPAKTERECRRRRWSLKRRSSQMDPDTAEHRQKRPARHKILRGHANQSLHHEAMDGRKLSEQQENSSPG